MGLPLAGAAAGGAAVVALVAGAMRLKKKGHRRDDLGETAGMPVVEMFPIADITVVYPAGEPLGLMFDPQSTDRTMLSLGGLSRVSGLSTAHRIKVVNATNVEDKTTLEVIAMLRDLNGVERTVVFK